MKHLSSLVVASILALNSLGAFADCPAPPSGIWTVGDLQNIQNDPSGSYVVCQYIDASGFNFTPIGGNPFKGGVAFTGTFDGQGYTISGLTINLPATDIVGLFGYVIGYYGGAIRNVAMDNVNVIGHDLVGGLVGYSDTGQISNVSISGSIVGNDHVGGLIGVGGNYYGNSLLTMSYSTASVTGISNVGGLVGGDVIDIQDSFSAGAVTGVSNVGGLVGNNGTASVSSSFSAGPVSGGGFVGGLVGWNKQGSIKYSFASGSVTGNGSAAIGGLVGENGCEGGSCSASVQQSYSIGLVSDPMSESVGGLVGLNSASGTGITDSYWDINTSNQSNSSGATPCAKSSYCGKLTGQLQSGQLKNFDQNVWFWTDFRGVSYPFLGPLLNNPQVPIFAAKSSKYNFIQRSATFQSPLSSTRVPTIASKDTQARTQVFIPAGQLQPWQYYDYIAAWNKIVDTGNNNNVPDEACLGTVHAIVGRLVGEAHPELNLQLACSKKNKSSLMCSPGFNRGGSEPLSVAHLEWFVDSSDRGIWPDPLQTFVRDAKQPCLSGETDSKGNCTIEVPPMTSQQVTTITDSVLKGHPLKIHGSDGANNDNGHWMLATSVLKDGSGQPIGLIAIDPWLGQQVRINLDPFSTDYQFAQIYDPKQSAFASTAYAKLANFNFKFDISYFVITILK